ncbi:23S rRNA (uracil(1939)-C(5))-methyltransferase RlmD [Candidatus Woesearchaeota archaeon]|nr:23S rRNA (uracil(1939)-C(5))-methyltransferase RlmD [Candidatus Woesearchaeota archaeon]
MSRGFKKKKKDFFENIDYSILESAIPSCPHFGDCGGCRFQNISYDSQIQLKKDYLKSIFKVDVDVTAAPFELGYRNRVDFVYAYGSLGMRRFGDFKTVVNISTCYLIPSWGNDVFKYIKSLLNSYKISSYDFIEHVGFLRYVTLRFVPSTQEIMAIFTTHNPRDKQEENTFQDFLSELSSNDSLNITSVYWFINDTLTDVAIPDVDPKLIIGKETLIETLGDTSLSFSPKSFFQVNSEVSKIMFDEIKNNTAGNTVDLCCGVGAISLFVRENTNTILGIEEVDQAIKLAKENADLNDVKKASYFTLPMKKLLDVTPLEVDTLIVDPPRSGLEKKVVGKILELAPSKIIYMSCNPKTQKLDIDMLTQNHEYEITFLKGYDMFPQTVHVETLCVLHRTD